MWFHEGYKLARALQVIFLLCLITSTAAQVSRIETGNTPFRVNMTALPSILCQECRTILEGPSKGEYKLQASRSPLCRDGCVYTFNSNRYCFVAGESIEVSACSTTAVPPAEAACPAYKKVSDGPLVGSYKLKIEKAYSVCTDGCLYELNSNLYCFSTGNFTVQSCASTC